MYFLSDTISQVHIIFSFFFTLNFNNWWYLSFVHIISTWTIMSWTSGKIKSLNLIYIISMCMKKWAPFFCWICRIHLPPCWHSFSIKPLPKPLFYFLSSCSIFVYFYVQWLFPRILKLHTTWNSHHEEVFMHPIRYGRWPDFYFNWYFNSIANEWVKL